MLDFLYRSSWGAFGVLLFMNIPFLVVFLYVIYRKGFVDPDPGAVDHDTLVKLDATWIVVVVVIFAVLNLASIAYMPMVTTAQVAESGAAVQQVEVEAGAWYYQFSDNELTTGQPVHFTAHSVDTVHSFAVYGPDGNLVFTLMLIPGETVGLTHTFEEPGTYTVRCLEYCGSGHDDMRAALHIVSG